MLYLVSVIHWDMKGPERLQKFLGYTRPSTIILEQYENVASIIERRNRLLGQIEELKDDNEMFSRLYKSIGKEDKKEYTTRMLEILANADFEAWASYEYTQKENPVCKLVPVGSKRLFEEATKTLNEGLEKDIGKREDGAPAVVTLMEELAKLSEDDFNNWISRRYDDSDRIDSIMQQEVFDRDSDMEPSIRESVSLTDGNIVFPCGGYHFHGDYHPNLYERLADLRPVRLKLPEVDKF